MYSKCIKYAIVNNFACHRRAFLLFSINICFNHVVDRGEYKFLFVWRSHRNRIEI